MAADPSGPVVAELTHVISKKIREALPSIEHKTVDELCQDLSHSLGDVPVYITDPLIHRFLRKSNYRPEIATSRLVMFLEEKMQCKESQPQNVLDIISSQRFGYIGLSSDGTPIIYVNFKWGEFLNVDGGVDAIQQALKVWLFSHLPTLLERDVGRRCALECSSIRIFRFGGTPPLRFVLACRRLLSASERPAKCESVIYIPNKFKRFVQQLCSQMLSSKSEHVSRTIVSTRAEVMAALKVDDSFIRGSVLHRVFEGADEPCASDQLLANAILDREWVHIAKHARKRGVSFRELVNQSVTVKNTFVEIMHCSVDDDASHARPYSSDDETLRPDRRTLLEKEEQHSQAAQRKTRRSVRKCGWTRLRRKKAKEKAAQYTGIPFEETFTAEDTDALAS